jgi:hypothetical protein
MVLALDGPADDPTTLLVPACTQGDQTADPARRLLELAAMFGPRGMMQSICADSLRPALHAFARTIGKAVSEPDCTSRDCPCKPPFVCKDDRCTCESAAACTESACDAIADGCGGPHYCRSCPGTLSCAALGNVNQCETSSTCPVGHVCMRLLAGAAAPAAIAAPAQLWLFEGVGANGLPDPAARMVRGMTEPVRSADMSEYLYDFDLTGFFYENLPEAHVAIAISPNDLGNGPEVGDQWYLYPQKLQFAPGWLADMGLVFRLDPMPLTPDLPFTVGNEGEGLVTCGAGACADSCCDGVCSVGCAVDAPTVFSCDGPEDCGTGYLCCGNVEKTETQCTAAMSCPVYTCHASAHCTNAPNVCEIGVSTVGFCQ